LQLESDVALKETEEGRELEKEGESITAVNEDFKGFGTWLKPANWSPVITFWLGEYAFYYILQCSTFDYLHRNSIGCCHT
jgi:hypothetical protein